MPPLTPEREKVLVLVRAAPEESRKYGHAVCVAGLNEKDAWRRLYPFEFQYGKKALRFRKRDLIEVEAVLPEHDKRKESRRVVKYKNLHSPFDDAEIVKKLEKLKTSINDLKRTKPSLGVVRPRIHDITIAINETGIYEKQLHFAAFSAELLEVREKVKMPVEVRYVFACGGECCKKKLHKILVIDWEVNELARNVLRREPEKERAAGKIRKRLFDWMKTRDVYFILGTHFRFKTFLIIGIFYPPKSVRSKKALSAYAR